MAEPPMFSSSYIDMTVDICSSTSHLTMFSILFIALLQIPLGTLEHYGIYRIRQYVAVVVTGYSSLYHLSTNLHTILRRFSLLSKFLIISLYLITQCSTLFLERFILKNLLLILGTFPSRLTSMHYRVHFYCCRIQPMNRWNLI